MVGIRTLLLLLILTLAAATATSRPAFAQGQRVLVIMSYDAGYVWEQDIRSGIQTLLANQAHLRFFYMDTKNDFPGGGHKARAALAVFNDFKPHGVIAADDNAQSLFVVPYLRNKVDTPVIFCGVNAGPETYGYPAANVTGVVERLHIRETIAFAQMLSSGIKTVGFLTRPNPTTAAILTQIESERTSYSVNSLPISQVNTLTEAVEAVDRLRRRCDALYLVNLNGLLDEKGAPMLEPDLIGPLCKRFGKPTMGSSPYHVKAGALLTVANSGHEQGELAARMLITHLAGTPLVELPISHNRKGQRMINLSTMRALGIQPVPATLVGVTFYEGE
jgi:ABC-type uncharacterized transport system substrate-binding protein